MPVLEIAGWWVSYTPWFYSDAYLYVFWSIQFALSLLRLLTIAEISRRSLGGYPAVWAFAWRILSAVAVILLSLTTYSVIQNVHHFRRILAVGAQRFEFMQAILVLLLLFLAAYYHVRITPLHRLILIGICIYSAVQVANDQVLLVKSILADPIFGYIRRGLYVISLAIWDYAVWRWGASSNTQPELMSQSTYDELSPQIHDRLRELNDKLAKLIKR